MKKEVNRKKKEVVKKSILDKITRTPWVYLILILLTIITYYQLINFGLIDFDDKRIIEKAGSNDNFSTLAFRTDPYFENSENSRFYRPIQNLSILIDQSFNSSNYSMFHFTNIAIHIMVGLCIFYFLTILGYNRLLSMLFSIIFLTHPLFSFNVAWIPARGDLLIALFAILSLICLHKYLEIGKILFIVLTSVSVLFAIFSKETAIVLPVILVIYEYTFIKTRTSKSQDKFIKNRNSLWVILSVWLLIILSYFFIKNIIFENSTINYEFGFFEFFNNLRYYPEYFFKFLIPIKLSGMAQFNILITGLGVACILLLFIFFIIKRNELNLKFILFSLFWIIIFLLPIVSIKQTYIPTLEYWEHRAYLPFIGIILILSEILKIIKIKEKVIIILSSIILAIFIPLTIFSSENYSSSYNFFDNIIQQGNTLPNAYYSRGSIQNDKGNLNSAIEDLDKAIDLDNKYFEAYFKRAVIKQKLKNFVGAIQDYNKALELKADFIDAYMNLGYCYYYQKDYKNATICIQKVLSLNPDDKDASRIMDFLRNKDKNQ